MSDPHEQFEYLCALEASDQISADERKLLGEHLKTCQECQQTLCEYGALSEALTERPETRDTNVPPGMYDRFRARAFNQGIRLARAPNEDRPTDLSCWWNGFSSHWWANPGAWATVAALALLITIGFVLRPVVLRKETAPSMTSSSSSAATQVSNSEAALQKQLRELESKQREIEADLEKQKHLLRAAQANEAGLESRNAVLRAENEEAERNNKQAGAEIQRLGSELERMQADKTAINNEAALQLTEVAELKGRIEKLDAELSREHRLSAVFGEMHDLMQNRDVHIIMLGSVNEGKESHAVGRAFYIPGQKLVLFAYNLGDRKAQAAHSFYVWGDKPGTDEPVKLLGTLTLEDQKDDRWAIRITNPDLFTRINEIFITMESSRGNVQKPTAKPMLTASLNNARP